MGPRSILLDDQYTVPAAPAAAAGVRWLRANVVRFSERADHRRRRRMVEEVLDGIDPAALERPGDHVATLADALGIGRGVDHGVAADVRAVAACYQPHTAVTPEADAAVARLVQVCGGTWDERTANTIGILVQACDATAALAAGRRPPVPSTRRVTPEGELVEVPLDTVPFGAGRHECPGRRHAEALAAGIRRSRDLDHGAMADHRPRPPDRAV